MKDRGLRARPASTMPSMVGLTALLIGLIAISTLALDVRPARGGDPWPMFGHDPCHTGYSASKAPDTSRVRWTYPTGGGVISSPAVVGGRLYVGSYDEKVYCLGADTGREIWSYSTGGLVRSSPAVADGRVYVGSSNGRIRCLDAESGANLWGYPTGGAVRSSPAVDDGRVYVGSDDGNVYCLDAETGSEFWTYPTGGDVLSSPAVACGMVYVGSYDGNLYCLSASSGAEIWTHALGGEVYSSPSVVDGKVYIGSSDYNVYCLNAETGAELWNFATGAYVESFPAVAYGRVYVGSDDHNLYCLDAITGDYIWSYPTGGAVWSSPAVAGGKVCVGSSDGNVYCLNAQTGARIWEYSTGGYVGSSPAIADGQVYIGSDDGSVYAFGDDVWPMFHHDVIHQGCSVSEAPDTAAVLWTYVTDWGMRSSPAVSGGRLYVGSSDDNVYCLDAETGCEFWTYTTGGAVRSSPAVFDGRVYVASRDGNVYCLENETGDPIWIYDTGDEIYESSPAVVDDRVYIGSDNKKVYCLDAETGDSVWTYTTDHVVRSSPAVAEGKVYVGSWDGKVYCLDAETGAYIWDHDTFLVEGSAAVVGGRVYVGTAYHRVYCLDADTGAEIWSYLADYSVASTPAVCDGKVYVGSLDRRIFCLDADNGDSIWCYTTNDQVGSSPAVADGKVYVGSLDSTFYCLDALDGTCIWSYKTGGEVFSSPAVAYGNVYVGSKDGIVHAFGHPSTHTLTVTATSGGWTDPAAGPHAAVENSLFEVTAFPDPDYIFDHWELDGLDIGSANPATVLMDTDYVLEAVFAPAYTLTITATAGGTTDPPPGSHLRLQGSSVEVTALAEACYVFDHWELDGGNVGAANPYTVFMNTDHTLDAVFREIPEIWPMFQRDQYRTGYTNSKAPRTDYNVWSYTTGGDVVSSPAFVGGMVYVGSADGNLYCLDGSTGGYAWSYPTGDPVTSSPAVAYDNVYVRAGYELYCLSESTGDYVWSHETGPPGQSSPVAAYGKVYMGSYDGDVYCFSALTGVLTWRYPAGDPMPYASPAVGYGRVYTGSMSGTVYCLDAETGELAWSYPTGDEVRGAPAIADSVIYVGSFDGSVYCLDALTGAYIWDRPTGGFVWSSPAVSDSLLYVGSSTGRVLCLHRSTGDPVWTYTTGDYVYSSPGVADGRVYVGSWDSTVYCLDASAGDLIWSYPTGDRVHSSPAIADTMVFIGSYDDKVYAFGPIHDIAIVDVIPADTVVCHGDTLSIEVIVENQGEFVETFGIAAPYFGDTVIPTAQQWGTFWSMGDVDRNGCTDSTDYDLMHAALGSSPGHPNWNPDADINEDLVVDMEDLSILAFNFGSDIWTYFGWALPEPGTQRGLRLLAATDTTLTFRWNSASVTAGDSTLRAHATPVAGEVDPTDNTYIDGAVTVVPDSLTLTISATAGGTTDPVPDLYIHACACSVQVTAFPDTLYYFDHWNLDGDDVGSANPYSVSMRGDHALQAVFYASYCKIRPTSIDFGTLALYFHEDTTFTITNTGVDTLSGTVAELCESYSIISGEGPYALAPGETLTVTVRFEPDYAGQHDCTIETGSLVCRDVPCAGVGEDVSGVEHGGEEPIPAEFSLMQNSPNPFGRTTQIRYGLPMETHVKLWVYNVIGQKIATLANEHQTPGYKVVHWDGSNDEGRNLPEGVYFYRLEAQGYVRTRKMVFLR